MSVPQMIDKIESRWGMKCLSMYLLETLKDKQRFDQMQLYVIVYFKEK